MIKLSVTKISNLFYKTSFTNHIKFKSTCQKLFQTPFYDLKCATSDQLQQFLNSIDNVVTDCDGVLWTDTEPIPGSVEAFDYFEKSGKKVLYVTNTTTKTRKSLSEKASEMGFCATPDQVLLPPYLIAQYLKSICFEKKVYIIGASALAEELDEVGIKYVGIGPDPTSPKEIKACDLDSDVGAVVVGYDRDFSIPKIVKAASYLDCEDCLFIAGNAEGRFPQPVGLVEPGTGALVEAIALVSNRRPEILSKPGPFLVDYMKCFKFDPARTLMIGDNPDTDIEFGVRCGFQTMLVLSGHTTPEMLKRFRKEKTDPLADVVLPKLGDLITLMAAHTCSC